MKLSDFLDCVCEALNRRHGSISMSDTPKTISEWDSLGHLSIVAMLDRQLRIPVNDPELISFRSIRELVDILLRRSVVEKDAA